MARENPAGFAARYAAGNLSSGQLVPVLLKAARSGSTWVGSILQAVSHRPFYLATWSHFVQNQVTWSIFDNSTRYFGAPTVLRRRAGFPLIT